MIRNCDKLTQFLHPKCGDLDRAIQRATVEVKATAQATSRVEGMPQCVKILLTLVALSHDSKPLQC